MTWMASKEHIRSVATIIGNTVFPPSCVICHDAVSAQSSICTDCFDGLQFISSPLCSMCGHPFAYEVEKGALCVSCQDNIPPYHVARAALRYDEHSRRLVTRFKFSDATQLAPYLARLLKPHAAPLLEKADWIVPVPLHSRRLRHRRYNQAWLLARALDRDKCRADILRRVIYTAPQTTLDMQERHANVAHVFDVPQRYHSQIQDKRIVLVDDVMTTGATIHACTRTLKGAGAAWVGVLTLAKRVIDDE